MDLPNWQPIAIHVLAGLLILVGFAGTVLPALPGVPLMFAGMLLSAWMGDFQQIGGWTLSLLGALAAISIAGDFVAGLLGAKRVGASGWAMAGAALGTLIGLFFGLFGLILGPFIGALLGELIAGATLHRATHVGLGAWLGFLLGSVLKIALAFMMLGVFLFALLV
ncbi:MAG: hypothetical protein BWZ07_01154 [Alphaproteobacteria bacterium ADurb.BinA280]|jgi:uncharacterized protein YqgC (DUF456 family)|nr:DUF456 domain-containing protein [Xanthomonadales bacterium]MCC6505389.1 DUF456 domain-containing protein [Aquimonas sp.]OPZ12652.1 MAG: hypothetical protein BWZ07_01154 [Alphaproteobacteria bacterium ADurb.BinA280]